MRLHIIQSVTLPLHSQSNYPLASLYAEVQLNNCFNEKIVKEKIKYLFLYFRAKFKEVNYNGTVATSYYQEPNAVPTIINRMNNTTIKAKSPPCAL
ncbi:hypothetical protein J2Z83_001243 [Virgibacillus natechei]|uniref:Uncharacterized protein n=1 Tax=Virgibacillus natechei TaxID=1216297 RepID=A0ABS4IEU4_9BACI|nr:hypothetical protein [Virgibacillus natechei]